MIAKIPLSIPFLNGNESKYVLDCIATGWVSSAGSYVNLFEEKFKQYLGVDYAVAVVNGTSALHLSLLVSGIQQNDEVLVPSLTFIAPVNAIRYCNAYPVFMDCDRRTLGLDIDKLASFLKNETIVVNNVLHNKTSKRPIKAIIPVHIFGHPCNMLPLVSLAREYGLKIIEDATESLGSGIDGESTQAKKDELFYIHDQVGYNYRLTNLQAAMGVAQMEQLADILAKKRAIAKQYQLLFDKIGLTFFREQSGMTSNYWLNLLILDSEKERNSLLEYLNQKNIEARPVWWAISELKLYCDFQKYNIVEAIKISTCGLSIPSSPQLTMDQCYYIVNNIREYFENKHNV